MPVTTLVFFKSIPHLCGPIIALNPSRWNVVTLNMLELAKSQGSQEVTTERKTSPCLDYGSWRMSKEKNFGRDTETQKAPSWDACRACPGSSRGVIWEENMCRFTTSTVIWVGIWRRRKRKVLRSVCANYSFLKNPYTDILPIPPTHRTSHAFWQAHLGIKGCGIKMEASQPHPTKIFKEGITFPKSRQSM